MRHNRNLGTTQQRIRRRAADPMAAYDRLPSDLRKWVAGAALPWSAKSCLALWQRALRDGATPEQAIARLDRAEMAALSREAQNQQAA